MVGTMPTGAPAESQFTKDLNLQIHIPTFNLSDPFSASLHNSFFDNSTLKLGNKNCVYILKLIFACTTFSQTKGLHISDKALIPQHPDCDIRFPPHNFPPFQNYCCDMP